MKKLIWPVLRFPDPTDGASAVETSIPLAPPAPASAPPAASIVIEGEVNEELISTRKKLDETERKKKEVETRASELEDENRRLKQAGVKPQAEAERDERSCLEKFMAGEDV